MKNGFRISEAARSNLGPSETKDLYLRLPLLGEKRVRGSSWWSLHVVKSDIPVPSSRPPCCTLWCLPSLGLWIWRELRSFGCGAIATNSDIRFVRWDRYICDELGNRTYIRSIGWFSISRFMYVLLSWLSFVVHLTRVLNRKISYLFLTN